MPEELFPGGGATALAEFFGDVMLVNGKIWPKMDVEPRNYRFHLLNGCDSRFLMIQFYEVDLDETNSDFDQSNALPFSVVGADQGLAHKTKEMKSLLVEPGARYDVVIDFKNHKNKRIIMFNGGPDEPFSGDADDFNFPKKGPDFLRTNRVMAFDVVNGFDTNVPDNFDSSLIAVPPMLNESPIRTRKLALFEGLDEFGRLQPLLGTAEPATDVNGEPVYWPNTDAYQKAGLAGNQMTGTMVRSKVPVKTKQLL